MTKSLDARIAKTIRNGGAPEISALLPDVEAGAAEARRVAASAREAALDPLLSAGKIAAARTEAEDQEFLAQRMDRAAEALRDALTAAQEAERQAELEVVGKAARKAQGRLRDARADFEKGAAALARHAENIAVLHDDLAAFNARLREGNCADLICVDPLKEKAQSTGQLVVDPLKDLVIWGHWPHIRPKTLKLATAG